MPPVVVQEGFNNGTGYLGGNSVPAMVNALATESHDDTEMQKLLSNSFLPVFGLDNESATYPFVDLWGVPFGSFERIELLCRLLPSTDDCMQTFKLYRDTAHVIFPGIIDISEFESELLNFLQTRATTTLSAESDSKSTQVVFGKDLHWLGLLFGALASGVQCSDLPRKERQMKSQVFGMILLAHAVNLVRNLIYSQFALHTNVFALSIIIRTLPWSIYRSCWL